MRWLPVGDEDAHQGAQCRGDVPAVELQGTNAHVVLETNPSHLAAAHSVFGTQTAGQLQRARHWFAPPSHPLLARAGPAVGVPGLCRFQGCLRTAMLAFLLDSGCVVPALVSAEVCPCMATDMDVYAPEHVAGALDFPLNALDDHLV